MQDERRQRAETSRNVCSPPRDHKDRWLGQSVVIIRWALATASKLSLTNQAKTQAGRAVSAHGLSACILKEFCQNSYCAVQSMMARLSSSFRQAQRKVQDDLLYFAQPKRERTHQLGNQRLNHRGHRVSLRKARPVPPISSLAILTFHAARHTGRRSGCGRSGVGASASRRDAAPCFYPQGDAPQRVCRRQALAPHPLSRSQPHG